MTELEFLKAESGLTDDEWKAYEALGTTGKLLNAVKKAMGLSDQALKDKVDAENQRLAFEKRYNDEFVPEMRKVTQDALAAEGRLAAAEAKLKKAREYGIVPEDEAPPKKEEPPRAPGSDPSLDDRFNRFSSAQSSTLIALNDLNAEHFKLHGQPLGNTQELVDEVQRQRTLGNRNFTLKQAWETKYEIPKKREEITKAERQKEIDAAVAADRKTQAEKNGANPGLRSGQPSKYSTYKTSDATKEPWKAPRMKSQANKPWRDKAVAAVREFAA